jgi:hypothetical protein
MYLDSDTYSILVLQLLVSVHNQQLRRLVTR